MVYYTSKYILWYHDACFLLREPEKRKKCHDSYSYIPASTAVKLLLGYSTGKIQSNRLEAHFEASVTMSESLGEMFVQLDLQSVEKVPFSAFA